MIVATLKKWNCRRALVDATGIGQPVASFLRKELGTGSSHSPSHRKAKATSDSSYVVPTALGLSSTSKTAQGTHGDHEPTRRARAQYRPNQTMNFYVEPSEGHDDFLMSLALVAEADPRLQPQSSQRRR